MLELLNLSKHHDNAPSFDKLRPKSPDKVFMQKRHNMQYLRMKTQDQWTEQAMINGLKNIGSHFKCLLDLYMHEINWLLKLRLQ